MDYKKEARKQYLKYFRVWFIVIGILAVIAIAVMVLHSIVNNRPRGNTGAPEERVYDYAGVLNADEEDRLRSQIAQAEKRLHMDIVIVIIDQPMEGEEAMRKNDAISPKLEHVMEAYADNFWDDNSYGYNKGFEGDGLILVDNIYEGQGYWRISSSGKAEEKLSSRDINRLLDVIERYYSNAKPYRSYAEFVNAVSQKFNPQNPAPLPWLLVIVVPVVVALIFAFVNSAQKKAKDTTTADTYVLDGKPTINSQRDEFIRKAVTQRRIQTSSGGGGHSGGHSGGGGHHHSRSGASHGGGGRRH